MNKILLVIMLFLAFSCSRRNLSSTNTYDQVYILSKIDTSIKDGDKRNGYSLMQEYEKKYIGNTDWSENKVNYENYKSQDEILLHAKKMIDQGDFVQAFFLYKLLLPEL